MLVAAQGAAAGPFFHADRTGGIDCAADSAFSGEPFFSGGEFFAGCLRPNCRHGRSPKLQLPVAIG
jgi:hypothetical protein